MTKLLFLDTETTGLNCLQNGIISLSGIIKINDTNSIFDFKIKPFEGCVYDESALAINNFSIETINTFQSEAKAYNKLINLFDANIDRYNKSDKFTLVGYNSFFDTMFLKEFFERQGNKFLFSYINSYYVDIYQIIKFIHSYKPYPTKNLKLESICEYYSIPLEAHDSLNDIIATSHLYYKLQSIVKELL